jgi:methyltransferase (TIGR00027 family)
MKAGLASRTALVAAGHRAAHQVAERGAIFADPLAVRIFGEPVPDAAGLLARRPMRLFIAVRHRFAQDRLEAALAQGVRQVVILGAGLDTTAYRLPALDGLRVFEVDHPATQAWKRARLAEAGIPAPEALRFVAVDFERDGLGPLLAQAGFDAARAAFFLWLGVVPYLTRAAILATLGFVAGLPGGAAIVFDYGNPPDALPEEARLAQAQLAERVAALGEPWISHWDTAALHAALRRLGLGQIEDLGAAEIAARYFPGAQAARRHGGHVVMAGGLSLPG